jgi:septin family protein
METGNFLVDLDHHQDEYLSPQEIAEIKNIVRDNNRQVVEGASTRNVLILGRSRSGKSTIVGVLKDPTFGAENLSIFASKSGPTLLSFSMKNIDDEKGSVYALNIIDTPGLQEQSMENESVRNDESILQSVMFCLMNTKLSKKFFMTIRVSL